MSDISKYILENSNNFSSNYDELLNNFSSNFGSGLPNYEKNESLKKLFFNYTIELSKKISLEYIEQYHNWLLQNFDLKPKK